MATQTDFNNFDWSSFSRNWKMWWDGTLDRPMVMFERIDPEWAREFQKKHGLAELPSREASLSFTGQFGLNTPTDEVLQFYHDLILSYNKHFSYGCKIIICDRQIPSSDTVGTVLGYHSAR